MDERFTPPMEAEKVVGGRVRWDAVACHALIPHAPRRAAPSPGAPHRHVRRQHFPEMLFGSETPTAFKSENRLSQTILNSVLRAGYYPVAEPPLAIHLPICNKLQKFLRSLQPILKNVIHSHKIHLPLPHILHF